MSATRQAAALALLIANASAAGAAQEPASDWRDELLRYEGDRHGTLGTTGRRLYAISLLPAPGFRGEFGLGDREGGFADPLVLEVRIDGAAAALEPIALAWHPSHVRAVWRAGGLELTERKAITSGDALLVQLALADRSEIPLDVELFISSAAAISPERESSRETPIDLSAAENLAPVTGTRRFTAGPEARRAWVEGEAPVAVAGPSRPEARAAASGGACLGDFGASAGERALYALVVPPLERPAALLRYARGDAGAAVLALALDGAPAGTLELRSTGGSGARAADFAAVELELGPLAPGLHRIELASARESSRVSLDGLFVLECGESAPQLPAGGAFLDAVPEQLLLAPGPVALDGVTYALADPEAERAPSIVALRGGADGDPARAFPERVEIELHGAGPAPGELHLLLALATPRGARAEEPPARIELHLDDGGVEVLEWPAPAALPARLPERAGEGELVRAEGSGARPRGGRADWRAFALPGFSGAALSLSYVPPPGRSVLRFALADAGGPEVPLLLSATHELVSGLGRVPVLLGRREIPGAEVHLALAGDGFVPEVGERGERALVHRLRLEPGEERRLLVALQCGPRPFQTGLAALALVEDPLSFETHVSAYWQFVDENAPEFTCSDPLLERAWHYRLYLLRHDLLRLDVPDFSLPALHRGLCCEDHARVDPAAAAHAIAEARWLRDPEIALGAVRALTWRQGPDGLLPAAALRGSGAPAPHRLAAAAFDAYLVNGSRPFLAEVVPPLERALFAELALFDPDGDLLPSGPPAEPVGAAPPPCAHFGTESEGAPFEPAERVELAANLFANARALAAARRELGEPREAERLDELADAVAQAVLGSLWSEEQGRFRALRERDGAPARCREIAALAPFAASLVPDEPRYLRALAALPDLGAGRERFDGAEGSCAGALALPASWTLLVESAAQALHPGCPGPVSARDLEGLLAAFARMHFEGGDPERPILFERVDPASGAGSGCPDLLDSAFADLLVRFVGGIVPRADGAVELRPLVRGLERFRFRGIRYRGRLLDVSWDLPDGRRAHADRPEGYALSIDGELRFHADELGPVLVR